MAVAALAGPFLAPAALGAVPARTSLPAVENDLMCVACHEPLAVSQSPQAESERRLISHLIALGDTKAQIERVMVAQYGPTVLARPPASGFDLSVYILPPAAVLVGLAVVGFALTRWRAGKRDGEPGAEVAPLQAGDARRLEEDLARYER
ncbi:MAG: cytochrome c-type biogenesis protein CcmH [Solirubrobacterales bacterium]|nr:cytochrome c-type biogenesis protein CcmH [Solirubrobacterales bacterium]